MYESLLINFRAQWSFNASKLFNTAEFSSNFSRIIRFCLQNPCRFVTPFQIRIENWNLIGTLLPDDLILVHEFGDHYSLQARTEMTVEGTSIVSSSEHGIEYAKWILELNAKITNFMSTNGERLTKDEWLARYPQATES